MRDDGGGTAVIQIRDLSPTELSEYARVSIVFEVREVLESPDAIVKVVSPTLRTAVVPAPHRKDYDALDGGPVRWPARFGLTGWSFLIALVGGVPAGAATVVFGASGSEMLSVSGDAAVLWDLRVEPEMRGGGVGRRLLTRAEARARSLGAGALVVETQQVNVPACRFYAANGFVLAEVHPHAYPDLPHEIQLVWRKTL